MSEAPEHSLYTRPQDQTLNGQSPATTAGISRRAAFVALAGIIVLAAALRFINLDANPIWWDEGNNAFFAHCSLAELVAWSRSTHDTNPPVHRLMLALWLGMFGDSAFSLRALSAALGVGIVVVVYAWGSWVGSRATGLLAALLAALSPMAVYYTREAKGYPVVAFFGLLALFLWFPYLRPSDTRHAWIWPAYIVAGALALGSHYYAAFLFVPSGVYLIADLVSGRISGLERVHLAVRWLLSHMAIALLVLPWVVLTMDKALEGAQGIHGGGRPMYETGQFIQAVLFELASGPNASSFAALLALVALIASTLYGLWSDKALRGGPLAILIATSILLAFFVQPWVKFGPRFLFYLAPSLCVLAAAGIVRLKLLAILPLACLAVGWLLALPTAYLPHLGPDEDLRPVAEMLREMEQPDDLVMVGYIWQQGALQIYAPQKRSYALNWFDRHKVDQEIPAILGNHPRIWLLTYRVPLQDEANPAGLWLETHAAKVLSQEFGAHRLTLYLAPCTVTDDRRTEVVFEKGIHLWLGDIPKTVRPNEIIDIPMAWSVDSPGSGHYKVFLHLNDSAGNVVMQQDGPPGNGLSPFEQMEPGETVPDCRALLVTSDIPAGRYTLTVGIYQENSGSRLSISGDGSKADEYVIGDVVVLETSS